MKKTPLVVRKAVLPVAGLGTRMLPATKAIPKEMLPVVDKPLIQYVVREAIAAGIKEIILVTHSSKNSIENHFDKSFELEATLEKRVKRQLLEEVQHICPKDVTIMHVRQGEAKGLGHAVMSVRQKKQLGLGHAVLCARPLIGDNPFVVLLPDVLIDEVASDLKQDNLAEMVHMFEADQISQIMVEAVPESEVDKYGIADIKGEALSAGMSLPMQAIVEKPPRDEAPSNLAVVGRYVLSANIWPLLEKTPAGAGDEIQLTDAIAMLMEHEQVNAYFMKGRSHDCGSKLGYMKANVEYAVRHREMDSEFTAWLKQFVKQL